jgi:hypothetical protein
MSMTETVKPVVVFHGKSEFEAQMARDALAEAEIPVLHVPSLSTGIFGVMQTTRVAVPEDYVEEALEVLAEAGFAAAVQPLPRGIGAFNDATRAVFPVGEGRRLAWHGRLFRVWALLGLALLALIIYAALRGR